METQKKAVRQTRFALAVNLILGAVLVLMLAIVLPRIGTQLSHAQQSLTEIDGLVADAGALIENANAMVIENGDEVTETVSKLNAAVDDAEELIENANTMVVNNTDAVTETVQKLNAVDFEGLNEAIENLNAAIRPLMNLASLFG